MRRVLATIGFSFLFTAIVTLYFGVGFSLAAAAVCATLLALSIAVKRLRRIHALPLLLCCVMLCSLCTAARLQYDVEPTKALAGRPLYVTAELLDYPSVSGGSYEYSFRALSVGEAGAKQSFKFSMKRYEPLEMQPYDQLSAQIEFWSDGVSPIFDYGDGVYLGCFDCKDPQITKIADKPLMYHIVQLSAGFKNAITDSTDTATGGLMKGLLFSDRSDMSAQTVSSFRECGLSHTTSVSGMHLTIIVMSLYTMLLCFGISRRCCSAVGIVLTLFYLAVVGFPFSASRAAIMMIIFLSASFLHRPPDALNSLGAATLVFVLINPYSAINASFLLSMTATLGMSLALRPIMQRLEGDRPHRRARVLLLAAATPFIQSVVATLFTLPLNYLFFGQLSIISPFANMLVVPLISPVIIVGMLLCLCSPIPFIAGILGGLLNWLCCVIIAVVGWFSSLTITTVSLSGAYFGFALACCLVLAAITLLFVSFKRISSAAYGWRCCSFLCAIMLSAAVLVNLITLQDSCRINLLSTGDGGCAVIRSEQGVAVLGAGGSYADGALQRFTQREGIESIDLMLLPSMDSSFAQCAADVVKRLQPRYVLADNVGSSYYTIESAAVKSTLSGYGGSSVRLSERCTLTALENASLLEYGSTAVVFINNSTVCGRLPERARQAEYAVVYSMPPIDIECLAANTAFLCSDKAVYAQRLVALGMTVYSTDRDELTLLTHGGGELRISKEVILS